MTISKKLLLIATLACNIPFGVSAHFDTVHLKDEVATILNYVSTLRLHAANHPAQTVRTDSTEIIHWVETKLEDTNWNTALESFHIVALANVIKNSVQKDAAIEETITEIQNIIANKNAEEARQQQERLAMQRKQRKETIFGMGAMAGLLAIACTLDYLRQPTYLLRQTNPFTVQLVEGGSK